MKIKQLGNGGAFNYEDCNSSFLIDINNDLLLVDCGYSVFTKLRELDSNKEIDLKNLKYIYITHMDDDHMGSLKTLMYYQYFVHNITTILLFDENIKKDMDSYIKFNDFNNKTIKENYEFVTPKQLLIQPIEIKNNYLNLSGYLGLEYDLKLKTFEGSHHRDVFGIIVKNISYSIAITGDTIAIPNIEQNCKNCDIVFHDFSTWNEPSKQVHACEKNIDDTYSKEFINKLTYYHNNKEYNKDWIYLESKNLDKEIEEKALDLVR